MILQDLFLVKNRRRISQSEIRNSAAAEKSESESEGGQKFLPPQPPSFLPARAFSFCRTECGNQSGFRSKKVRASFSNCDQTKLNGFCEEFVCSQLLDEFRTFFEQNPEDFAD